MNTRYPLLSFVSVVLRLLGFGLAAIMFVYGFYEGIYEPNLQGHHFGTQDGLQLISGVCGVVFGLLVVALGELIGVLFDIEHNTRSMCELLQSTGQQHLKE